MSILCRLIGHNWLYTHPNEDNYYMKNFECQRCGKKEQRFV